MPNDKRDFFRVNQDVLFDYKVVDAYTAENEEAIDPFENSISIGLINELKRLDRDNQQALKLLSDKNRLLGDYLQTLSNKIDLIARHSLFAQEASSQGKPTKRINLSEDGLAFLSERALYKDSYIAARMVFLPSYSPVLSFAKVLRCEPKEDHYQVAAKFFRMNDGERQTLSKLILRAQVKRRKNTQQEQ